MTKYICATCDPYDPCSYESGRTNTEPCRCPLMEGNKPDWKPIGTDDCGKPQLPDWCKPDEYIWDDENQSYRKVLKITDKVLLSTTTGFTYYEEFIDIKRHYREANLRPYNKVEMRTLVGKVIDFEKNSDLVLSYDGESGEIYADDVWFSGKELLNNGYTYLGKPCGILEHLNEKGEWVE